MQLFDVLRRPLVTEKNTLLQNQDKYCFEISKEANKLMVKQAVEKAFKVSVTAVNIIMVRGKEKKVGRKAVVGSSWKKAVVTLKPGDKIQIFEGL